MDEGFIPKLESVRSRLARVAVGLAVDYGIENQSALSDQLFEAWHHYIAELASENQGGSGHENKLRLLDIAKAADDLSIALQRLPPLGRGLFQSLGNSMSLEDAECVDVAGLPSPAIHYPFGDRRESDARWVYRLNQLASLAETTAEFIQTRMGRGGRRSLHAKIHGTPQEALANECRRIAAAHGQHSQACALKMMWAIQEAEHGKNSMLREDGKPSRDTGRKAVRKVAQTGQKKGTV